MSLQSTMPPPPPIVSSTGQGSSGPAASSSTTTVVTATSTLAEELMEEALIDDGLPIPDPNRWFFTKEQLENTPSRRAGIEADKELMYRQQCANLIQDIGQRLQVNQLCINTAIVYMHRFFMYHPFTVFQRNSVSTASVFLAAKVEEQPRKLEYVIKVAQYCVFRDSKPPIDLKSEQYTDLATELVSYENVLLQTLGFDVAIDHPHTHVVKCCQLVRASKDLAQTSYFMATNSLHLTTMCLEYKSSVVACVCIHLACKWSNWEIPRSKEGKDWFWYVDGTVTIEQLEQYTNEFLTIFNKSPSRLKKKIISLSAATRGNSGMSGNLSAFPSHFNLDPSSPGMPQFSKSRSPSPSDASTAGKLRLPPIKSTPQPLFSMRPVVKTGAPVPHHGMGKPHPVSSSSNHPPGAPPPPAFRQSTHPSTSHPVPSKSGHPQVHSTGPHGASKDHQKPQPLFPPTGYHPSSSSGMTQNSYPTGGSRPQPSHSSNIQLQGHQTSSSHGLPPQGGAKSLFPPAPGSSNQHSISSQNLKQPFAGMQQQPTHVKPHHLTMKPSVPGQQQHMMKPAGQQQQPQSLKRPYPTDMLRPENRPDLGIKREPRPMPNHVSTSQGHIQPQMRQQRPPDKQDIRHPAAQSGSGPTHQSTFPQQSHGAGPSYPAPVDGRPWMDRFLDNEVNITQSQPMAKPIMKPKPQLDVSSSGLPVVPPPPPLLSLQLQVSSSSSTIPAVIHLTSMHVRTVTPPPATSVTSNVSTESTPTSSLLTSSTLTSSSDLLGQEGKKKKEKKHKKDKHRDKDEKEHKHKDKHNKEEKKHKKQHKEKHKSKEKHRSTDDFSIDSAGNKLKIIIGRNPNPNVAQESKDSNSKSSKHSKEHHTATIVNY